LAHGTFFDGDLVSGCGITNLIAEPQIVLQVLELFGFGTKTEESGGAVPEFSLVC
jgi:hypothetical protein